MYCDCEESPPPDECEYGRHPKPFDCVLAMQTRGPKDKHDSHLDRISNQTYDQLTDIIHMVNSIPDSNITLTTLKRAQRQDKDLKDLIKYLQTDELPEQPVQAKTVSKQQNDYILTIQTEVERISRKVQQKYRYGTTGLFNGRSTVLGPIHTLHSVLTKQHRKSNDRLRPVLFDLWTPPSHHHGNIS